MSKTLWPEMVMMQASNCLYTLQGEPGRGLPGPKGLQGLTGIPGFQGDKGSIGLHGIPGQEGQTGPPGSQGITGTVGDCEAWFDIVGTLDLKGLSPVPSTI